jgi:hypothetical protein
MANPKQPDQENELPVDSQKQQREAEAMHDILLLLEHMTQREKVTVELIVDRLYDVGATNLIEHKIHSQRLQKTVKPIAKLSKSAFRIIAWYWFKQNCPQLITDWLYTKITFEPAVSKEAKAEVNEAQEPAIANGGQAANHRLRSDQPRPVAGAEQIAANQSPQSAATIDPELMNQTERQKRGNHNGDQNGHITNSNSSVDGVSAIVLAKSPSDRQPTQEITKLHQQVRLLASALVVVIVAFSGSFVWLSYRLNLTPADIFSEQTRTTLIEGNEIDSNEIEGAAATQQ